MNEFDFKKQLVMSAGVAVSEDIGQLLLERIPGALKISKASERDDRSGTDYWIDHARGVPISVDTKIRNEDPIEKRGRDDLALETWSVVGTKIGWTLDETKRTDYILWWFKPTRRWVLIPFLQLQAVFKIRQDEWLALYKPFKQKTVGAGDRAGWYSECVFVPRREIWAAIYTDFGGSISSDSSNDNTLAAPRRAANDNVSKKPPWTWTCLPCNSTGTGDSATHLCPPGDHEWKRQFWIQRLRWAMPAATPVELAALISKPIARTRLAELLGDKWLESGDIR
jgi:hypothetical protein